VDHVLAFADLENESRWGEALVDAGVFTADEFARIAKPSKRWPNNGRAHGVQRPTRPRTCTASSSAKLIARCGDLGKRIHTGRSRNDQVATDLQALPARTHLRLSRRHRGLCSSLVGKAEQHWQTPMPGYTHLQRAQPIGDRPPRAGARRGAARATATACSTRSGAWTSARSAAARSPARRCAVDREALARRSASAAPTHNSLDATAAATTSASSRSRAR
jgi:argininosuccinate lyase